MAKAEHYMVFIDPKPGVLYDELEKKMNLSYDWFRIRDNLWIIYTTSDKEKWMSRLTPLVESGGQLFICKLDTTERQGWMKKSYWKWLSRESNES